ncbi:hypothetical protein [Prosthecobacter sp.]|uniref:hypothetical protein n=1 Tax=Prosthecobacter sp. TaxID=1965333 RepID=UPI0037C75688
MDCGRELRNERVSAPAERDRPDPSTLTHQPARPRTSNPPNPGESYPLVPLTTPRPKYKAFTHRHSLCGRLVWGCPSPPPPPSGADVIHPALTTTMTSPMPPFTFNESAPSTARRVTHPEDTVCAIIYASVILLLCSRVLLQILN